jgi:hyperosmotically inducible periplasmic protein
MSKQGNRIKIAKLCTISLALIAIGMTAGCSAKESNASDRAENVRRSLASANLKDVTVNDDRDKGVMTLGGQVATDGEKAQAESIAKSGAGAQVVADEIAVIPAGFEKQAKAVNSDLDKGIGDNLDAALIQQDLHKGVTYSVKNGVVTLSGEVRSQALRTQIQTLASRVPNVLQVVNELQVKNQKASSSN